MSALGLTDGDQATVYAVATGTDGRTSTSDSAILFIVDSATPLPFVELAPDLDDVTFTQPTDIIGSATSPILDEWMLEYRLAGDGDWTALSQLADTSAEFTDSELGVLDTSLMLNGIYDLRLSARDLLGRTVSQQISITVDGSMKVGNFSLAFEDLTVPMAGIPIQIVRAYDSLDTRSGDFGTGWTLALNNIRLRKNGPLGENWEHIQVAASFGGFPSFNYILRPIGKRLVSVTFPDGEQHLFELSIDVGHGRANLDPNANLFVPIGRSTPVFTPRGDTTSTLEAVGPTTVFNNTFVGPTALYTEDPVANPLFAEVYDPTRFILTTADGTRYLLDENEGLISMEDLNGNTLEVFDDRIVSTALDPNGGPDIVREVNFLRDAEGRITTITDPDGNTIE